MNGTQLNPLSTGLFFIFIQSYRNLAEIFGTLSLAEIFGTPCALIKKVEFKIIEVSLVLMMSST